jgi:hypothetical protein
MSAGNTIDARQHPRFELQPMYTEVTIQRIRDMAVRTVEGHAYDVSEAGVRIEMDEPLDVDERVSVCLSLGGDRTSVFASGRVVWVNDEVDDPGPRRMAIRFTRFLSGEDRTRLLRNLGSGEFRLAA